MASGAKHVDRLLPRHVSGKPLTFRWYVPPAKKSFFKKVAPDFTEVDVKDISLEGALIEVDAGHDHPVKTPVRVEFNDAVGDAEIRHSRVEDNGRVLYGLRFVPGSDFSMVVDSIVGEIRGNNSALKLAWNKQN